jgi:hypothetical protein
MLRCGLLNLGFNIVNINQDVFLHGGGQLNGSLHHNPKLLASLGSTPLHPTRF